MNDFAKNIVSNYTEELKTLLYIIKNQHKTHSDTHNIQLNNPGQFVKLAERFRLTPHVFKFFNDNKYLADNSFIESLKTLTINHSFKSLSLLNELLKICKEFNSAGVKYVVIKGPQLSHLLYSDATFRVSVDNDIFLKNEDSLLPAISILKKTGYKISNLPEEGKIRNKVFFIGKHEIWFFKKSTKTSIDLHIRPVRNSFFSNKNFGLFLKETKGYSINNVDIPVLNAEKYFLFLCYHGVIHSFSSLHWLNDVYLFSVKRDIDKEKLMFEAKSMNLATSVKITYFILNYLFDVQVPGNFKIKKVNAKYRFIISRCLTTFTKDINYSFSLKGRFEKTFYTFLLSETMAGKTEALTGVLFRYFSRFINLK